jgi:hypothetical protein
MSQNNKLKVAMQLVLAVSAAGVATVLHNAPASAETYTPGTGAYAPADYTGTDASGQTKNISGQAKAQILQQITSASAGILDFGKVVPSAQSGTITINADGTLTNAGGARYIANSGATVATLAFSGQPNQNISVDVPVDATIANGANTMTVNFNYPTLPTSIGASGNVAMNYGGTLNVAANQAAGIYSGTYDIFVTYVA